MARLNSLWFEFAGSNSATKSLKLLALPDIPRAETRVPASPEVLGRDGSLWLIVDGLADIEITVRGVLLPGASVAAVSQWLTGSGLLRFSNRPNRAYRARALKAYTYKHSDGCATRQVIDVTFACHPCAYHHPATSATLVNGVPITNPGTRYAEPKITVVGSGDVDLTIGGQTLYITGLGGESTETIVLDMEARVAYHPSSMTNRGNKVSGDWPLLIQPGSNAVSWTTTGTVTSITIEPNWRDI